ncbi:MAG: alpha/beta hydrolase [Alphaproteobacteria bacterium]|nr:alpha/beta hydrolase [Alphaproteobacteria bacterium]
MSLSLEFTEINGNEIPKDSTVGSFESYDGLSIRYGVFKPVKDGVCHGTVCLFGGRSEPIEKYFETIKKLQLRGFCVTIMDWRGQGLSDRLTKNRHKGHVKSFENYVKDVEVLMKKVALADCPAPYFALAHSTGANILTQYVALPSAVNMFERMVLISPFYKFDIGDKKELIIRIFSKFLTWFGMGELKATFLEGGPKELKMFDPDNLISSDRGRMKREQNIIKANLNLALGAPTFGWLNAAFDSIAKIKKRGFVAKVKTPILAIMGTEDYLVSQQAMQNIIGQISGAGLVKIDGGRHELLMENDKIVAQTWAAIDAFLPGTYDANQTDSSESAFS